MYKQELKIPKERVAILIGKKGETKKKIEEKTNSKIKVSSDGEVTILSEESFDGWIARQIVLAIGRGFSPEKALLLLNEINGFELIELKDWANTENALVRLKSRVIGEGGKAKRSIEQLTNCYISVYGKTIGIIGDFADIPLARRAIEKLLSGARHATVYRFLEKERKKKRMREILGEV